MECLIIFGVLTVLVLLIVWASFHREGMVGDVAARPVVSYYEKWLGGDKDRIVVTLHFTEWCPACKAMKGPWNRVKTDLATMNIAFVENDEDKARTPWVQAYPTIVLVKNGKSYEYKGRGDYEQLRAFILDASKP